AARRARAVARAREAIVGVNQFPDIGEAAVAVLAPYDATRLTALAPADARRSPPLAPRRLAEPFERLRDRSDVRLAEQGVRPRVFLANLGSVAAFTQRANFAKNFFEAGGVEAVNGEEAKSPSAIVAAFRASGAKLACLCGSDADYGRSAEQMARELTEAGARVYLAGRPGELEARLRTAGVAEFIYEGCDMLDVLQRAVKEAA
ncbi:MAG: methylmalonyl-CoA mutase, partial [Methylocystis sp.]|nr:methylmalonyl-CoA mutase [Methylocystis sp.]